MIAEEYFKGVFITDASVIQQKLKKIKAFIFDWDGVFNDGRKDIDGNSSFSEVDSMGVNMMRFSYYLFKSSITNINHTYREKITSLLFLSHKERKPSCSIL